MTSKCGVDSIARELRLGTSGRARPVATSEHPSGFRFAIDADSELTWPDLPYDPAASASRYDARSLAGIVAVLDDAGRVLASRAPRAHALVSAQTQRVLVRRSEKLATASSASHRARVGMCLLTNLHLESVPVRVAIEALVHESIHQRLYRIESVDGMFCDLGDSPTFRSPWTGARLPLHSLVHACFVWFGLLSLWSELAPTAGSAEEAAHARARIAHCLFGYAFVGDLLADASFPAARLAPDALACIGSLCVAANEAAAAAELPGTLRDALAQRLAPAWPVMLASRLAVTA